MLDAYKDFAKGAASTGYNATDLSIILTTGDSAKFPAPPFNFTWWNATDYPDPADDPNKEICRCTAIATETWTITRAQESTSASTKNTGGKTYQIIAPLTAKALNTDLFTLQAYGVLLPNAKFVPVTGLNLAIGQNDLYTVPTGKRALVGYNASAYNASAGSIAITPQVKIGGTYLRLGPNVTITTLAANGFALGPIVLEAGDILSILTATTAGLNIWISVVEFDNTSGLKSPRIAGPSSGDNTLYTVSAGKAAYFVGLGGIKGANVASSQSDQAMFFVADAGGTRNIIGYLVPSGGAKATTNQMGPSLGVGASTRSNPTTWSPQATMAAGDFIVVNVDVGAATELLWANLLEV